MSLLGQINIAHSVGRVRSIGHAPYYVKGLTYDRLHERFERPHHALGNRYRNPLARAYDIVLSSLRSFASPFRNFVNPLSRIEISIRLRPKRA